MQLRQLIIPLVSGIMAVFLLLGFTVGYVQYSINENNRNINIAEQTAIQKNNQLLCGVITTLNQSTKDASDANHSVNSYSIRLQVDFKQLDNEYKCGS